MCRFCEQTAFGQDIPYNPQLGRQEIGQWASNMPPDLIFLGGTVITMDPFNPEVGAIAIREGIIQAVGETDTLVGSRGRMTRVINLDGRAILPGLIATGHHLPQQRDAVSFDLWVSGLARAGYTTVDLVGIGDSEVEFAILEKLLLRRHRLRLRGAVGEELRSDWSARSFGLPDGNDLIRVDAAQLRLSNGISEALSEAHDLHHMGWSIVLDDDLPNLVDKIDEVLAQAAKFALGGLRLRTTCQLTQHAVSALRNAGISTVTNASPDDPVPWLGRTVTLAQKRLSVLTGKAARLTGTADICGCLRSGLYADFTILDRSPLVSGQSVPRVLETWIEGVPVRSETDHVAV
jgi:hypothetical protein